MKYSKEFLEHLLSIREGFPREGRLTILCYAGLSLGEFSRACRDHYDGMSYNSLGFWVTDDRIYNDELYLNLSDEFDKYENTYELIDPMILMSDIDERVS